MALATQCPFCQTTFRVAQDQLKLRGGLVRCGACKEVFNGNDHLVAPEIARQLVIAPSAPATEARSTDSAAPHAPLGWPPLPGSPPVPPVHVAAPPAASPAAEPSAPATPPPWMATANLSAAFASIAAETNDAPWGAQPAQKDETPAATSPETPEPTPEPTPAASFPLPGSPTAAPAIVGETASPLAAPDASINTLTQALSYPVPQTSSATPENAGAAETETVTAAALPPKPRAHEETGREKLADAGKAELEADEAGSDEHDEHDEHDEDAPAFVQKAERRERRGRIARVFMIVGAVVLGIALLLQATYVWRNTIAAWLPSTRPLLAAACAPLHCSVGLPTSIDQLVLESSELQLVPPNQNIYTLSALLRNRGYGAQAWPYLELTLNDGDEKAITRRVFTPREYLGSAKLVDSGLAGEGEQQIKMTFELTQPAASGYRIYLFYP